MVSKGAKKQTNKVLNEIQSQLVKQAERWGRGDYYTPVRLEEMELDQCYKIRGDLMSERANLEYELNHLEYDKKESLIKLERLESYLKKAERVTDKHRKNISQILGKQVGDPAATKRALGAFLKKALVSVFLGEN